MRVLKEFLPKRRVPKHFVPDKTCAERVKPFLLLFKWCGLFANDVTAGRLKRCSWPTYGICVFWIGLSVSFVCYASYYYVTSSISLKMSVYFVTNVIGYISLGADVITAYSSQNHFSKFFDRLDGYDHEAARIRNKRRDNLWIPWIIAFLMTFVSLFILIVIIISDFLNVILLLSFLTMIRHIYSCLEKFLLLYLVLQRFKHLNEKIAPNVSWDEERCEPNAIKIWDVKIMHSMLRDAHKAFNDTYENPLLLSFASFMIHIGANLSSFRQRTVLLGISFVGPPMMLMLIICTICHYTAEEANNIACALSKSMTRLVNSGKTPAKIGVLAYFLHNSVSFEAAGYFTIDLPLFHSVVATLTTYFLILV